MDSERRRKLERIGKGPGIWILSTDADRQCIEENG